MGLDASAFFFLIGLITLASLLFGFFPAWISTRTSLGSALKDESSLTGRAGSKRQRGHSVLVVGQVGFTCVLLIGAGLLAHSFQIALSVPLGFNPDHVLTAEIYLTADKYKDRARVISFFDALLEKTRRLQGATAAEYQAMIRSPSGWRPSCLG